MVGTTGSGKTTFARELARQLGVPHIELDAIRHQAGWVELPDELFRERVSMATTGDGWVVDGNYGRKLGDLVRRQADTVVWLDQPLPLALWRLWLRTVSRIVRQEELWNGNRESWRGGFWGRDSLFAWTLRSWVRHRREWPHKFAGDSRVVRLRSADEARRWLERQ